MTIAEAAKALKMSESQFRQWRIEQVVKIMAGMLADPTVSIDERHLPKILQGVDYLIELGLK